MPALAVAAALLFYGSVVLAPDPVAGWYVPLNVAAATVLTVFSLRLGLTRTDLGLSNWSDGIRLGLAVSAIVVAALAIGAAIPATQPLFDDARLAGVSTTGFVYRTLIRIPFGTALFEEAAFRGVLFGLLRKRSGTMAAVVGSSIVFGLWHIRPTLDLLAANSPEMGAWTQALAVTGSVLGTAAAGVFFCALRLRAQSLAAPFLVHASVNSTATVLAWIVR